MNRTPNRLAVITIGLCAAAASADDAPSLRDAAKDIFLVGAAVRPDQLTNPATAAMIARQFSSLTPENVMKMSDLQPGPGRFTFEKADVLADFAKKHEMALIGHTLCWHTQAPKWMFEDSGGRPLPREQGLANLKAHITGVLTHFKGKVRGWDVVNEALSDKESEYLRDTPARRSIGDDFVVQAFKLAQAADPDVELYYNDYNIDHGPKLAKAVRLIGELKAAGCKVTAVGSQSHWQMDWPKLDDVERGITTLAALGVKVHITELDIDVLPRRGHSANVADRETADASRVQNPYADGLPDDVQRKLADRYAAAFALFKKHKEVVTRVTTWGVDDGMSWLNNYPIKGRTNYPLLIDRAMKPKPALAAVVRVLRGD